MSILVTGGAGYIGSHATRRLVQEGEDVVVVDDLSHGHRAAVDPRATLVVGSTLDSVLMAHTLRAHRVEAVLHFASAIEVAESAVDPGKYYANNVAATVVLLEAMRREGVKKLVFSSTAAVYGSPAVVPIPEDHARHPISTYGRTKHMVELILADYAAAYDFGAVILRYFNVAGAAPDATLGEAHEPETHLIPCILAVAAAPDGRPAALFGTDYATPDGTCVRDFVHVEDLVTAHRLALAHVRTGRVEAFNVGSERGFSVRQVIEAVGRVVGRSIAVVERPRRVGDPDALVACSDKIRSVLGFNPAFPELETMIEHAWKWHSAHPQGFRGRE